MCVCVVCGEWGEEIAERSGSLRSDACVAVVEVLDGMVRKKKAEHRGRELRYDGEIDMELHSGYTPSPQATADVRAS